MVFAYYRRLSPVQRKIYRRSDEIASIRLRRASALHPAVHALAEALQEEDKTRTQTLCQRLADGITSSLNVPTVRVEVLTVRPHDDWGELHGLYSPAEGRRARVQLWMRTVQHKRVVAFKTFLRTLLHELCHHLDYELLNLPDSFHTEGFYKRLSSLSHQLTPAD